MTQSVYARVKLEVEVPSGSSWGPDCTMAQIQKQAIEGAISTLERALVKEYGGGARLVGKPKVTAVLASEE